MTNPNPERPEHAHPILRKDIHTGEINTHLERIHHEFEDGFAFLKQYPKSVTVFGSSLAESSVPAYKEAYELTGRITRDLKYAVITGGGPGIMEAANKGAFDAGGPSLSLNISLPHEHNVNPYVNHSHKFAYFFSRKAMLMFAAEAYVFFPGGYGTFDELFGVLTLIQTGKIPHVPIILFGSSFWNPFQEFMLKTMCQQYKAISEIDLSIFKITDSVDETIEIIKKAPVNVWWRNIN